VGRALASGDSGGASEVRLATVLVAREGKALFLAVQARSQSRSRIVGQIVRDKLPAGETTLSEKSLRRYGFVICGFSTIEFVVLALDMAANTALWSKWRPGRELRS